MQLVSVNEHQFIYGYDPVVHKLFKLAYDNNQTMNGICKVQYCDLAGGALPEFSSLIVKIVEDNGNLFLLDREQNVIHVFDITSESIIANFDLTQITNKAYPLDMVHLGSNGDRTTQLFVLLDDRLLKISYTNGAWRFKDDKNWEIRDDQLVKQYGNIWQSPANMALDEHGFLFVTDQMNHQAILYDINNNSIKPIYVYGGYGYGEGFLNLPGSIVQHDGSFILADRGNHQLVILKLILEEEQPPVPNMDAVESDESVSIAVDNVVINVE